MAKKYPFYCNGKKAICEDTLNCDERCQFYDGTGGEHIPEAQVKEGKSDD